MRYGYRTLLAIATASLMLSACGGGGSVETLLPSSISGMPSPTPAAASPSPSPTPAAPTRTSAIVTIGSGADAAQSAIERGALAKSSGRRPMYVSPSTTGIAITVSPGSNTQAYDVSAGSPLCTAGSPRTCTLSINAPAGFDTFTLTEYDQKPVSGSIPGSAHALATTTLTQTISSNTNNTLNFFVDGIISGVATSGGITFGSLPADGAAHTYAIALVATDADGNSITAGSTTPYSNPITVSLTETGGSGHSYLVLNGTNVGSSATVSHSTDALSLHYDGGGSPGYTTSTAISSSGATGTTLQVSPLYVSGSYLSGTHVTFTATGQTASLTASEAGAGSSVAYTQSVASCGSYMSSSGSGSGASAAVSITANTAPYAPPTCTVNVYDNLGSTIPLTVALPTPTQQCASAPLGTQIDANDVSSGSRCALQLSSSSLTVYAPGDGSHPASQTFTVTENHDTSNISISGCGGDATFSPSSVSGAGSISGTASGTITVTAQTANTSCNLTVSDGSQSQTVLVTVDPSTVTSSGSGTYSWTSSSTCTVNPAAPPMPTATSDCNFWGPVIFGSFNTTVAPTTAATELTVTIDTDTGGGDTGKCSGVATGTATTISLDNSSGMGTAVGNWTSTPGGMTFTYYNASAIAGQYWILLKDPCTSGKVFSGNFNVSISQNQ